MLRKDGLITGLHLAYRVGGNAYDKPAASCVIFRAAINDTNADGLLSELDTPTYFVCSTQGDNLQQVTPNGFDTQNISLDQTNKTLFFQGAQHLANGVTDTIIAFRFLEPTEPTRLYPPNQ